MTTKNRKQTREVTLHDGSRAELRDREENIYREAEFDPAEESFSQFRNKFGTDGVVVKVYRRTPRGVQYCFSGVPSEIDEETIRLYHCKQSYAGEEGQYSARCYVNGDARDAFPILIAPQIATPGTENGGGLAGGSQSEIVRLLLAQNERLESRFMMQGQAEREPLSSLADAMLKIQQMMPQGQLPVDQLMKAIELGKQLGGGDAAAADWKPLIMETIREGLPLIRGVLSSVAARSAPVAAVNGGDGEGGNVDIEKAMLAQTFNYLKRKCLAGSDPGLYIDIVFDNRDDATYQRLIHNVLTREFSEFVSLDPEIGKPPFLAFFQFLYDGLRSAVKDANTVAADTVGPVGDSANTESHGKPRKAGGKKS